VRNLCWLALLPVVCGAVLGCTAPDHPKGLSWLDQMRAGAALGPNSVYLETALIERPVGDPYINHELWTTTDELIVDLDKHAALEANGLRVGQLVGTPPAGFQTLLLSKRSCSNPKGITVAAGKAVPLYLDDVPRHCEFAHVLDDEPHELEIDNARFGLEVVPTLTPDGRTKLRLTPTIETGENLLPFQPAPEESRWMLRIDRPCRKYPDLAWDVALAPGQYLIVGARLDRAKRFGRCAFVQEDDTAAVQRLLVLRTTRSPANSTGPGADDFARMDSALPLARQAASPAIRAKGE
jgi:hypothetical protein